MFDFPASPAVGDVSNGYVFNGVGWSGGPAIPTPTEQFFICDGMATLDVQVPAWAKGCEINGAIYISNTAYLMARVSMDGTTFLAGASDYIYSGAQHNSQGGASAYITYAGAGTTGFTLSATGNNGAYPINVNAEMILARALSTQYITSKSYAKNYNSTASAGYLTYWSQDLLGGAPMGSGLQVKALRFLLTSGNFGPGSWLRIKWLGGEVPQTNGTVPEAPADGWQYTRVNGVWRPTERTFVLDGLLQQEFIVPSFAKGVQINGSVYTGSASGLPGLHISTDGTNYIAGSTPYTVMAMYHDSGTSPYYGTQGAVAAPSMQLGFGGDNLNVPQSFIAEMGLVTATTIIGCRAHATSYRNTAPLGTRTVLSFNYTNVPAGTQRVQKFRLINGSVVTPTLAFAANSYCTVKWLG